MKQSATKRQSNNVETQANEQLEVGSKRKAEEVEAEEAEEVEITEPPEKKAKEDEDDSEGKRNMKTSKGDHPAKHAYQTGTYSPFVLFNTF